MEPEKQVHEQQQQQHHHHHHHGDAHLDHEHVATVTTVTMTTTTSTHEHHAPGKGAEWSGADGKTYHAHDGLEPHTHDGLLQPHTHDEGGASHHTHSGLVPHTHDDGLEQLHTHDEGGASHHTHSGIVPHTHDGLAPHTHEPLDSPGFFSRRAPPLSSRDFHERAFTVGIGGPVGSGKTALMLALCEALRDKYSIAAVTNDIFTKEDGEFLVKNKALAPERICAVQTGGCPHAAIREDISINLGPLEELSQTFDANILLCESGGDNLAANFSRELADNIIYIIDVSGGDKIPRKGGPGITQADLLVINKTDLAEAIGADLKVMEHDALHMRDGGPIVFAQVKHGVGVQSIVDHVVKAFEKATKFK